MTKTPPTPRPPPEADVVNLFAQDGDEPQRTPTLSELIEWLFATYEPRALLDAMTAHALAAAYNDGFTDGLNHEDEDDEDLDDEDEEYGDEDEDWDDEDPSDDDEEDAR